jgi:methylated-DNA-[protein]-cysteine S-methyltransferase
MNRRNLYYYQTPLGKVAIAEENGQLTNLWFEGYFPTNEDTWVVQETEILREAGCQLQKYFEGQRREFDLPLGLKGTEFMQAVWEALRTIPYGETRSYRDISEMIERPKAYRAVGQANNRNPLPIFIPCHRVIGADGNLVGYGGGLVIKEFLLKLEQESE